MSDVNVTIEEDAVSIAVPDSIAGHATAAGAAAHAGLAIVSASAPTEPADDQLWYDKSAELMKRWDDAAGEWVAEGRDTYVAVLAPSTEASRPAASADNAGAFHLTTDVNGGTLYRSNGTSWVQASAAVNTRQTQEFVPLDDSWEWAFGSSGGAITALNHWPVIEFQAGTSNPTVTRIVRAPSWATTLSVDLYWTAEGTAGGAARWRASSDELTGTVATVSPDQAGNFTAPSENVPETSEILSAAAVNGGSPYRIEVGRNNAYAGDTNTDTMAAFGVMLKWS